MKKIIKLVRKEISSAVILLAGVNQAGSTILMVSTNEGYLVVSGDHGSLWNRHVFTKEGWASLELAFTNAKAEFLSRLSATNL
jgi:hypothetical protein